MGIMDTSTQQQIPRGDRTFGGGLETTLLYPMLYPIKVNGSPSVIVSSLDSQEADHLNQQTWLTD